VLYIDGERLSFELLEDIVKLKVLIADDGFLTLLIAIDAEFVIVLFITIELLFE
jgi:hypothetical protein